MLLNRKTKEVEKIEEITDSIKQSPIFAEAFTHVSLQNETKDKRSYERLEFLGDSILNFQVSLFLYTKFPHYSEGKMSKLKQLMVREKTLAFLSKKIKFSKFLGLGKVEKKNNGEEKKSILSDVFESFIAALYLEKGQKKVHEFLELTPFPWVKNKENITWDYKSRLQEFCQAKKNKVEYIEHNPNEINKTRKKQIFIIKKVFEERLTSFAQLQYRGKARRWHRK